MIFIPSVVGRILGWSPRFLTLDVYALYCIHHSQYEITLYGKGEGIL